MDKRITASFIYFLIFYSSLIFSDRIIENGIYYKAPKFNVKNTNVTFGIARPVYTIEFNIEKLQSFTESLTAICQVELINKKKAQVSIDGIINLVFQEYNDTSSSGQHAIIDLLSNNLYFTENNTKITQVYDINLTGFFSYSNYGTSKINSLSSNYYGIPFVASGDYSQPNPDSQFSGPLRAENITLAQVTNTYEFNSFNAVLEVLKHFNWTLVGNLFQSNTYGFNRQQAVLDYSAQNSEPIFTCGFVYEFSPLYQAQNIAIEYFCRCVKSKASINVIILWMTTSTAFSAINYLNSMCSASKSWTFIITDDFEPPVEFKPNSNIFKNSLLIRNSGPWDFDGFINECKDYSSPETKKIILSLLDDIYSTAFKCKYNIEKKDIPLCPDSIQDRNEECACTKNENTSDSYKSSFFYIADGLSVYAEAISLIQNNCTMLNENRVKTQFYYDDYLPDFCSITEFSPIQLSYALRFVNFTGYTGPISFPNNILIRKTKPYYLYSVYNNNFDATLVGYINETGTTIYNNLVSFINNQVPVSEIVPQNPDLSYAVVNVFFGLGIAELIFCIGLLIFIIYYRNEKAIRQCAPLVTITMLIGVIGLTLAQIFLSFARTDAWCSINLYLFRISFNLILMALLVKNYRIYKIFANKKATAIVITESRLLIYIGITTLFYIIVLTVIVSVFGYKAVLRQSTSNPFYQFIKCLIPNKTWNSIFQISLDVIIFIQIILSLILAWLTKKVQSEYRESRRLAAFASIMFACVIIFVPLNYTLGDSTNSQILRYVTVVQFLTLTILSAIAILFIPIVISVYGKKESKMKRT